MGTKEQWIKDLTAKQLKEIKRFLDVGDQRLIAKKLKKSEFVISRALRGVTDECLEIRSAVIKHAKKNGLDVDKLLNL